MRGFFRILDSFVQNNQKNMQNSIIFVHFAGSLAIASCRFPHQDPLYANFFLIVSFSTCIVFSRNSTMSAARQRSMAAATRPRPKHMRF
jgi:hypothetical protein